MQETDTISHHIEELSDTESPFDDNSITLISVSPLADTRDPVELPETSGNSSLILDLTADELNFINDIDNERTRNIDNSAPGSSVDNSISLDDDTYAFFVEAGLEDPDELAMLGIDIEEIRNQRTIAERLEQQNRTDFEAAQRLQRELEQERYAAAQLSSSSSAVGPSTSAAAFNVKTEPGKNSFMQQLPVKRENTDNIEAESSKRPRLEVMGKGKQTIDLIDDEDCIDLTDDIEGSSSAPIPLDYYNAAYGSVPIGHGENHMSIYNCDDDDDDDDEEEEEDIRDYLSFVPWNRKPHNGMAPPPYGSNGGDGEYNRRSPPAFPLFPQGDFGFHVYGSHMARIANQEARRRPMPNIVAPPVLSSKETEKELRDLLENVLYDEPPPPEERTGTPEGLCIELLEHQKIGLQWMLKMENSNNKGGILADDMGLGKTIQAMSVIVENPCENPTHVDHSQISSRITRVSDGELHIKATLIVCPVSLIDQWRREIESKTDPKLNVLVYHGGGRTQNPYDLALYDVVISSYAITASNFNENRKGPFAQVKFHRVILDEAHTIKNKATRGAIGCCALDATYRWCMTATPIQNKVEELYSLIKFLRIRPFCDWDEFRECIAKPMKNGDHKKAIKVAHVLMKAISLRRSKKALIDGKPILNLPERNVHMTHIDFSPDERNHYDFVNQTAQARFNKYMAAGTVMKNYSSVLVLLLRLRQACLHPELTLQEGETEEQSQSTQLELATKMKPEVVKRLLDEKATLSEVECPICMDIADNAQIIVGCGHILCKECFDGYWNVHDGNQKRCPQCRGELDNKKLVTVDFFLKQHAPDLYKEAHFEITEKEKEEIKLVREFISSAKIDKMLDILDETDAESGGQDKTIVFSQFTGMLDMIEKPMKDRGHTFLRYDGSMDIKERAAAVNRFFDDPDVKVLLVSTKCGSLGLNLTIANRVIILDVWWNPALENQAIDRVHRIGQNKAVDVHRIFINDTVEDRILELQNKKQAIADGVLGEGTGQSMGRLGLAEMIYLFRGGNVPNPGGSTPNAGNSAGPSGTGPSTSAAAR